MITFIKMWFLIGAVTYLGSFLVYREQASDLLALLWEYPSRTKAIAGLIAHLIWHSAQGPTLTYTLIREHRTRIEMRKKWDEYEARIKEERRKAKENERDWRFEE